MSEPLRLWHGARAWEGPPAVQKTRRGRAEHGPGIYLTTSYQTAAGYAKGGGTVMLFELDPDLVWLEASNVPLLDAVTFVQSRRRLPKKAPLVADLRAVAARMASRLGGDSVPASSLVNLLVNYEVLSGSIGPELAGFMVDHGISASLERRSAEEDWVVLFDPRKILGRRIMPALRRGTHPDMPKVRA